MDLKIYIYYLWAKDVFFYVSTKKVDPNSNPIPIPKLAVKSDPYLKEICTCSFKSTTLLPLGTGTQQPVPYFMYIPVCIINMYDIFCSSLLLDPNAYSAKSNVGTFHI